MFKAAGSRLMDAHLARVEAHYDQSPPLKTPARSYRAMLARYYNLLIEPGASVLEIGCGEGELLANLHAGEKWGADLSAVQLRRARARLPAAQFFQQAGEDLDIPARTFDYVILSDTVNLSADVQLVLSNLRRHAAPHTRLLLNSYNPWWRPLIGLGTRLGLREPQPESNWLSQSDLTGLMRLSGWEAVRFESRLLCPVPLGGLERFLNRWVAPLVPAGCLALFAVARPTPPRPGTKPLSVSVIIPARNEAGNIEQAVLRTPALGLWTELIFVEGHSKDETWPEIQRLPAAHPDRRIKTLRQPGHGKGDAVRAGFQAAEGDLLMILDADLTVPPEELPKFYAAVAGGLCEFANGSRLVYPMEERAMRFFNLLANKAFGSMFSSLLGQPVKDTLCGTKALRREDYFRLAQNRSYFGDFDPFGDFDLLFGASKLNLQILDVPIRYRERTYGQTNISRWKHGWLLLRMVLFAAKKLKFV
ncbi:MAG TPA: glycosyltransferase [Chthoniobacterales bacterium]